MIPRSLGYFLVFFVALWGFVRIPLSEAQANVPVTTLSPNQAHIYADQYGDDWPFTVADGIVECVALENIVFHHGGVTYALNANAQVHLVEMGWKTPDDIQAQSGWGIFSQNISLDAVIAKGVTLCHLPVQSALTVHQQYVQQEDYGDDWPFTVPNGIIECQLPNSVIFHSDNVIYAVNGQARGQLAEMHWLDLEEIWRNHPDPMYFKMPLGDVLTLGHSLCEAKSDVTVNTAVEGSLLQLLSTITSVQEINALSVIPADNGDQLNLEIVSNADGAGLTQDILRLSLTQVRTLRQARVTIRTQAGVNTGTVWTWAAARGWSSQPFEMAQAEPILPPTAIPPLVVIATLPPVVPTDAVVVPAVQVHTMLAEAYTTTGAANIRSCPETTCTTVTQLAANTGVMVTGQVNGQVVSNNNGLWYRIDYNGQEAYIYSGVVQRGAPAAVVQQAPAQAPVVQQPPANSAQSSYTAPAVQLPSGITRPPANCAEAVAWELTAVQAAQWSHLDRDGDGVACYGD